MREASEVRDNNGNEDDNDEDVSYYCNVAKKAMTTWRRVWSPRRTSGSSRTIFTHSAKYVIQADILCG